MKEPYTLSGMSDGDDMDGTMIGCPSCAGVLALRRDDEGNHSVLQCSIGHTFSFETLLEAKEEQLEESIWSAVALLAHLDMIIQKLLERPMKDRPDSRRQSLQQRIAQARLHAEQMRAMIEEIRRPNLSVSDELIN